MEQESMFPVLVEQYQRRTGQHLTTQERTLLRRVLGTHPTVMAVLFKFSQQYDAGQPVSKSAHFDTHFDHLIQRYTAETGDQLAPAEVEILRHILRRYPIVVDALFILSESYDPPQQSGAR